MSTLSTLKTRIQNDIVRTDKTTEIAEAITDAISHYQKQRFLFSEERVTFSTVASQSDYTASDDADIGRLVAIEGAFESDGSNTVKMARIPPNEMERLQDDSASSGEPYNYSYFGEKIRLYPVPDGVYTVIFNAQTIPAAPASDAETGNPWMEEGFELIRSYAKRLLAIHVTNSPDMVSRMNIAIADAEETLRDHNNALVSSGYLGVSEF